MTVEISREKNRFGNCLKLANGQVEVLAAIDYGPRIVSFKKINGENLFFEDVEGMIHNNSLEIENVYGAGKFWKGKGGHRFWIAPEKMPFTYYPDDSPVNYEIEGNILRLLQAPQIENGIQLTIELMMEEEKSEIKITHIVKNISNATIELERHETEDVFMSPKLQSDLGASNWSAFASDIQGLHFNCYRNVDSNATKVDCRDVLSVCQYPRVKFALSNMGNYWVSTNKSQHQVIQDAVAKGILLRW